MQPFEPATLRLLGPVLTLLLLLRAGWAYAEFAFERALEAHRDAFDAAAAQARWTWQATPPA